MLHGRVLEEQQAPDDAGIGLPLCGLEHVFEPGGLVREDVRVQEADILARGGREADIIGRRIADILGQSDEREGPTEPRVAGGGEHLGLALPGRIVEHIDDLVMRR